jgi:hypothetical protein
MTNGLTPRHRYRVELLVQRNVLEPIVIITTIIILAQRIVLGIIIVNIEILILIIITQRNILGILITAVRIPILVLITVTTWRIVVGIIILITILRGTTMKIIIMIGNIAHSIIIFESGISGIIIIVQAMGMIIIIGNIALSIIIIVIIIVQAMGIIIMIGNTALNIIILVQGIAVRIMTDVGHPTTLANQWTGTPERITSAERI